MLISYPAFRSVNLNKSFRRRTKCRLEYQTTFCRRVGCFPERSPFLSALCGVTKVVSRAWTVFQEFYERFVSPNSFSLPVTTTTIVLFVSYLRARKLAPFTISSCLSAISYVHKMKDLRDPTKTFLIQKLLTTVGRERSHDSRLPITKPVLFQLVRSLQHTLSSAEQRTLFTAMFLIAFYGFFSHRRTSEQEPCFLQLSRPI